LGLSPDQHTEENVKQILNALTSVIDGVDALSNKMDDRHRRRYKPERRHAKLVVNAAKTIVEFL
jgi:abortive infection Abi-like protein